MVDWGDGDGGAYGDGVDAFGAATVMYMMVMVMMMMMIVIMIWW
jgi:hypothetical protein